MTDLYMTVSAEKLTLTVLVVRLTLTLFFSFPVDLITGPYQSFPPTQ